MFEVIITIVFLKSTVRPLPIGKTAIVENLKHDVEHVTVCFLHLIEQNHRIRPAPDSFRELAAFLEPDIARRRADQPRHSMPLLVFGHVDPDHRVFVVKQELSQRARQLGFANAGRSQKNETAYRPVWIFESCSSAHDSFRDGSYRFILADDAFVKLILQVEKPFLFAFEQLRNRYSGPAADDLGDVLLVNFLLEKALLPVLLGETLLFRRKFRSSSASFPYRNSAARFSS